MRIAGFIRLWPSHRGVGGMQGHAANLYRGLVARGHEVHVLTTYHPGKPAMEVEQGVFIHYLPGCEPAIYSDQYFNAAAKQLEILHRQQMFDVIHSESDCARRQVGGPIPVVVTWHGIAYCSFRSRLNLAVLDIDKSRHLEELQKTADNILKEMVSINKYDHSIAISDQAYSDLVNVYGIPQNKLSLVYNGFDTTQFTKDNEARQRIRQLHKIPQGAFVLGVVGRIVPDKGHRQLINALKTVIPKNPNIHCLVVGEGALVHDYQRLGFKQITIVGPKQYNEMPAYYNAFDQFVNPTTRYLGLDMSIQEAMLCGTPVLASDVGSISRSLIVAETVGDLFAFNDVNELAHKILESSKASNLIEKGLHGQQLVRGTCSIEKMCKGTEEAFAKAIRSRAK